MTDHAANQRSRERHAGTIAGRRAALRTALGERVPEAGAIVWEVGSGHGHFLTEYAAANPGTLCVGVDIMGDRVERAQRKQRRAMLPNLAFFHAEAFDFLAALPPAVQFASVIVLFPDPWPKARHHKNRLLQSPFLDALAPRMGPAARLYFRTDHAPYFASAREAVLNTASWRLLDEAWPIEPRTVFQDRAPTYQSFTAAKS